MYHMIMNAKEKKTQQKTDKDLWDKEVAICNVGKASPRRWNLYKDLK